jgi:hypothetical protein
MVFYLFSSFFLSLTGQAGLIQVDMPIRGNNQACRKIHPPIIKSNINKSFIFAPSFAY